MEIDHKKEKKETSQLKIFYSKKGRRTYGQVWFYRSK